MSRPLVFLAFCFIALPLFSRAKAEKPPDDFPYLLELLQSKDVTERRSTAQLLGTMGFKEATPALIEALNDDDPKVQLLAAEALGKLKDPRAVEPLIAKARTADDGVKRFIFGALGKIKDPLAFEVLTAAVAAEPNGDVRASAAYALGELGDPAATKVLTAALSDEYKWVRFEACGSLAKLRAFGARAALAELANGDPDAQVRGAAAKAVGVLDAGVTGE